MKTSPDDGPRQPRILYFASQVSMQSGATHAMIRLADIVHERGPWTMIAAPFGAEQKKEIEAKGIPVEAIPFLSMRGTGTLGANAAYALRWIPHVFRLMTCIRRHRIDIVHVNEISDVLGIVAARLSGRRCVMHVRAHLDPSLISRPMLLAARWASYVIAALVDLVIVPSQSTREEIASHLPGLLRRTVIVNDVAFDVNEFHSDIDGCLVRKELGIAPETPVVLLASKLALVKGHLVFFEAACLVAERRPDVVFLDVGDVMTDHHEEGEVIRARARAASGRCDVRMLGYRKDLPNVFAACDIYVHCPVYHDPFPTVVPEAKMMRKAVIGSRIGGIPEQITDGVDGLLVAADDAPTLAAAILNLLDDPDLRGRLAKAAEQEAVARYLPSAQASAQISHYAAVLGRSFS